MSLSSTPTGALSRAEEEIHQRIVSLSNLRVKRNFFLPVFRLPPETLATIFVHGARDCYESDDGGHFGTLIPTWVNVSYVCRHWRSVALNCPILWTYHFNLSLRWTEELLLRSKEAPLKISCVCPPNRQETAPWLPNLLDKLLKYSERIQELRLEVPMSHLPVSFCAYRLEKPEMNFHWDTTCTSEIQSFTITGGDDAPLQILKLVGCELPLYSFNLTGLKILSLRGVNTPSPFKMADFLVVLGSMQNLATLYLAGFLPSAHDFVSGGGLDALPEINLPCLTLLEITAPISAVIVLLSCINISPRTQLCLEPQFEHGVTSIDDYAPISLFLSRQFSTSGRPSDSIFHSLTLNFHFIPTLTFGLDRGFLSAYERVRDNVPLKISLEEFVDEELEGHEQVGLSQSDVEYIIDDICRSLPLTNIQSLHVVAPQELSSDFWEKLLGHMDGLRYMKLSKGSMPDLSLLSIVSPHCEKNPGRRRTCDQDPTREHIFVPALKEMVLENITFVTARE